MTNVPGPEAGRSADAGEPLTPDTAGVAPADPTAVGPKIEPTARQTSPVSPSSPPTPADGADDPLSWAGRPGEHDDPAHTTSVSATVSPEQAGELAAPPDTVWPVVGDPGWPIATSSAAAPLGEARIPPPAWPPTTPGPAAPDPGSSIGAADPASPTVPPGTREASPLSEPVPAVAVPDARCPHCGSPVNSSETFCENCGEDLLPETLESLPEASTADADAGADTGAETGAATASGRAVDEAALETRAINPPAAVAPDPMVLPGNRVCADCGGHVGDDLYCEQCGTKAPSLRDHFVEQPAPWIAGVCDRGVRHPRNEDALALWAEPDSIGGTARAALVVCDGVSTSSHSDAASLAAVRAAIDVLAHDKAQGIGVDESRNAVARRLLAEAAAAANDAVVATAGDASNPPSCTYAVALLEGRDLTYGNIGDSRVYWIGDRDPAGQRDVRALTIDDSMAEMRIQMGVSREVAESSPQAHAITRWLGADAPDLEPTTGQLRLDGTGWLLVCSDGLWNYASEAGRIAELIDEAITNNPDNIAPEVLASSLVRWANLQGGKDNISVALARIPAES